MHLETEFLFLDKKLQAAPLSILATAGMGTSSQTWKLVLFWTVTSNKENNSTSALKHQDEGDTS